MNPDDHAAHLRQTADLMETAALAIERERELESNLKKWREHLNGEIDRRLMMERGIAELLPVPADDDARPQFERLLERLRMANEVNRTWDELVSENDRLRRENETLARNVPPEPPADMAAKPDLVYVGQRWCRSGRTAPDYGVVLNYPEGWVVLCESWLDRETGKLTDIPVPVRDLPEVSAQ
jgi:hypothetical protein